MIRKVLAIILWTAGSLIYAQNQKVGELEKYLSAATDDSTRVSLINQIAYELHNSYPIQTVERSWEALRVIDSLPESIERERAIAFKNIGLAYWKMSRYDSSLLYQDLAKRISDRIGDDSLSAKIISNTAVVYADRYQYAYSLEKSFEAYRTFAELGDLTNVAIISTNVGVIYKRMRNYQEALMYLEEAMEIGRRIQNDLVICANYAELGDVYLNQDRLDESMENLQNAISYCKSIENNVFLSKAHYYLGNFYAKTGERDSAISNYRSAFNMQDETGDKKGQAATLNSMVVVNLDYNELKAAEIHLNAARDIALENNLLFEITDNYYHRVRLDSLNGDYTSALRNYKKYNDLTDSLNESFKSHEISQIILKFETESLRRDRALQEEELKRQELNARFVFAVLMFSLIVIVFLIYILISKNRTNKQLKSLNSEILEQKEEIRMQSDEVKTANREARKRNRELSETLQRLRNTQSQLIESEKMASIGILTAGLAHELNNPLNIIGGIIDPIKQDLKDIKHHARGDRSGEIEPILDEIESLLDDVGQGAKKATSIIRNLMDITPKGDIEAIEIFDFKEIIGSTINLLQKVNPKIEFHEKLSHGLIVKGNPAELNQVVINLLGNAVDAIPPNRKGVVRIAGELVNKQIVISIIDNGSGIEAKNFAQIFEPFFTTKEPGKGTGLGLYISQSIIKKHSGELVIESSTDQGTAFVIYLPASIEAQTSEVPT